MNAALREQLIARLREHVAFMRLNWRNEPEIADDMEAAAAELAEDARPPRMFPVQNGPAVPWSIIEPFEKQCRKQHGGQTLEEMARRGGLSVCEVLSILDGGGDFDVYWRGKDMHNITANILRLQQLVRERTAV